MPPQGSHRYPFLAKVPIPALQSKIQNGAGKTTTISMITGVLSPSGGTARVGGHDIHTHLAAPKTVNGLVPQDLALYPTLSARANLDFLGRIYGLHGKELRARVQAVLNVVALADRAGEAVDKCPARSPTRPPSTGSCRACATWACRSSL